MRINRENTLIEDNSYPLAGMREEDICKFFTDALHPYTPIINQLQGALLLHNVPLFCTILAGVFVFLYSFRIVSNSEFPTVLFIIAVYPLCMLLLKLGGGNMLKSLCIKLPVLPENEPARIRPLKEIVALAWMPILFAWRVGFFVYRVFVCPNIIDIAVLLFAIVVIGLLCCAIDVVLCTGVVLYIALICPALFTRKFVYNFIRKHLGNEIFTKD